MSKRIEIKTVVDADAEWKRLCDAHPQLTEKMIVDLVNGLEVVDDHLRVQSIVLEGSVFGRALDSLTGKKGQRDFFVQQNLAEGLRTTKNWVIDLSCLQAKSHLATTLISDKLQETRQGVLRLQQRINQNEGDVQELFQLCTEIHDKVNSQYQEHNKRFEQLEAYDLAVSHIESVMSDWSVGKLAAYPVYARVFLACSNLHWGDFGAWLRTGKDKILLDNTKNTYVNKIAEQIAKDLGKRPDSLLVMTDLLDELKNLTPIQQEMMQCLSQNYSLNSAAYAGVLQLEASRDPFELKGLDYVCTPILISQQFLNAQLNIGDCYA